MIHIIPYKNLHQNGVDELMKEISEEFDLLAAHPDYKPSLPDPYWVAEHASTVVGTIGMNHTNGYAVLKRMFLKKHFRGKEKGIAGLLLQTAFDWCRENSIHSVYLGTMERFNAAQTFYEKKGFRRISENELPDGFVSNPVDDIFYKLDL